MEFFVPEWAPNLHPLVVHFPIAILSVAVVLDLFSFFVTEKWWDERKTIIIYLIGTLSAIGVYFTGQSAADSIFIPTEAQGLVDLHSDWALWTVWFFGLYTLLRAFLYRVRRLPEKMVHLGLFLLSLIGIFFLFETGEHGAEMVFGYSVGTGELAQTAATPVADSLMREGESTFLTGEEGDWSWEIGQRGVEALLANFKWIEGEVSEMNPTVVQSSEGNYFLRFSQASDTTFFITKKRYQNIQVDFHLSVNEIEGQLELVHHARDAENYDFVRLNPDGLIQQGRVEDGREEVFAKTESDVDANRPLFIRVVGNGTHYRAYLDKELLVHGHGDALEAGGVGLKLQGSGEIMIDRIGLTPL